jgi:hypothetical protein
MSEEENNVALEEAAPVVEEQVETGAESQVAAEEKTSDKDINWSKARETMAEQSYQLKALKAELETLRGQQASNRQQEKKANDLFEGRDGDDLLTVADLKKALTEKETAYQNEIAELKIRAKYPDFDQIINKHGSSLEEIEKDAILRSSNPYEAAYRMCQRMEKYEKADKAPRQHSDAVKATKNLQKPGSASAVGGAAALSEASRYESMSDAEILEMSYRYSMGQK